MVSRLAQGSDAFDCVLQQTAARTPGKHLAEEVLGPLVRKIQHVCDLQTSIGCTFVDSPYVLVSLKNMSLCQREATIGSST